ncbi:MAG: PAS domain-containing protein [Deinococcota bacterium]
MAKPQAESQHVPSATRISKLEQDLAACQAKLAGVSPMILSLIQHSPVATAIFDTNMCYIAANTAWVSSYNLAGQDILGKSHYEIFPDIGNDWKNVHTRCLQGAHESRSEDPYPRDDGSLMWLDWSVYPWLDLDGEIAGIVMNTEVVSGQVQAREEARVFRKLVESSSEGIVISDLNNIITYANGAYQSMVGAHGDDLIGQSLMRYVGSGYNLDDVNDTTRKQGEWHGVIDHKQASGDTFLAQVVSFAMRDNTGALTQRASICRDVTDEQRLRRSLIDNEQRLQMLLNGLPVMLFATDLAGTITLSEGRELANFNFKPGEIVGQSIFSIYRDVPQITGNVERALNGENITFEAYYPATDQYFERYFAPIKDTTGTITGMMGIGFNITERKRSEADSAAWRERYDLIVASSGQVVYEYDIASSEIKWSGSVQDVLGFSQADMAGGINRWAELIHPDDEANTTAALEQAEANLTPYTIEYRFQNVSGDYLTILDRGFFQTDDNSKAVTMLGMMQNISERKAAEQSLQLSELRLQGLLDNLPVIVFATDDQGVFTFSEGKGLETLGLQPGQVVGMSAFDVYADNDVIIKHVKEALQGTTLSHESEAAGQHFETYYIPLTEADGTVSGLLSVSYNTTLRKQSEQALEDERSRLQALYEAVPDIIMRFDSQGTYLDYKPANYFKSYALPQEVVGKTLSEVAPAEIAEQRYASIQEVLTTGEMQTNESSLVIDGQTRYRENRLVKLNDNEVLTFVRDITDLKHAEEALLLSELRLKALLAHLPIVVFATDEQGTFTMSEGKGLEKLGLEAGQVVGQSLFDLYSDSPDIIHGVNRALAGETASYDTEIADLHYENYYVPLPSSQGTGVLGVSYDITERKQSEQALEAERSRLQALYEAVPDIIARYDRQGRYLDYKPAGYFSSSFSPEEIIGKTPRELAPPEAAPRFETFYTKLDAVLETGEMSTSETTVVIKGETRHRETRMVKLNDDEAIAFTRDITDIKRVEAALRENQQFLEDAQSMGQLGGWSFDLVTQELYWSKQIYDISEAPYDTELTVELATSIYVDPAAIQAAMNHTLETHEPYDVELEIITLKGNRRWTRSIGKPIVEDGEVVKLVGTHQDITDMKQAQAELEHSNERLANLNTLSHKLNRVDSLDDMLAVILEPLPKATIGLLFDPVQDEHDDLSAFELIAKHVPAGMPDATLGARYPLAAFPAVASSLSSERGMFISKDIAHDSELDPATRKLYSELGLSSAVLISLIHADKVIGLIGFYWQDTNLLENTQLTYLNALSSLTTPVFNNHKLLSNLEHNVNALAKLNALSTHLNQVESIPEMLEVVLAPLPENTVGSALYPIYEDNELVAFELTASAVPEGFPQVEPGTRYSIDAFPSIDIWRTGSDTVLTIEDVSTDTRLDEGIREVHVQLGLYSMVFISLLQANKIVGLVGLYWPTPRNFSTQDVDYFKALSSLLAPVTVNRRLLADLERTVQARTHELQKSQALLQGFLDNVPAHMYVKDTDLRFIMANDSTAQLCNTTRQGIVGRNDFDFFDHHAATEFHQVEQNILDTRQQLILEQKIPSAAGLRYFITAKFPIIDQQGNLQALGGFSFDTTEMRREVQESRNLLRLVIHNLPNIVVWKNRDLEFLGVNNNFARVAGFNSPDEMIGKTDYDTLFSREQADAYREDDLEVITTGRPKLGYEESSRTEEGQQAWVRTSKMPLRNEDGEIIGIVGLAEDITESKALEANLRSSNATLTRLSELSQALNQVTNKQELLEVVSQTAFAAGATAALLFDIDSQYITGTQPKTMTIAAISRSDELEDPIPVGTAFQIDEFASANIWLDNPDEPALVTDVLNDSRMDATTRDVVVSTANIYAYVSIPLRHNGRWIGILNFNWDKTHVYLDHEIQLYQALTSMVPPALASLNIPLDPITCSLSLSLR